MFTSMVHTLIQIQSYLFIISQPKISFPFLTFKESSYMVFTSTCHYFYPVSHFETANGIHYLLKEVKPSLGSQKEISSMYFHRLAIM